MSPSTRGRAAPRRRWLRRLAVVSAVPLLVALVFGAAGFAVLLVSIPLPEALDRPPAVLLDRTGQTQFAQLGGEFARLDVPLEAVPQHMIDAVLAAEDADFYTHPGVNITSVIRAALANVRDGAVSQGGSTITQQYVKVVTADDERTLLRKIREAALAVKLERTHSKQEILELYLNAVYFGRGAYGVQAAARAYFGVDAGGLDPAQSALLAGLLPAPSRYDPLVDAEAAVSRYWYVLSRMEEEGWLDPAAAQQLRSAPLPPTSPRAIAQRDDAPWFTDLVRRELEALGFGDARGLQVVTTLNLGVQRHAERAYAPAFADTSATGALVAVDPATGGILAVVGGEDYASDQVNLALADRQPGSTFKPVALAAWLEDGRSPDIVFDAPGSITIPPERTGGEPWTVSNYGGGGFGAMTLREATWRSVNTVYAQAAVEIGPARVADMAQRLIPRSEGEGFAPFPSLVLGTEEVTARELAGAYATFAAGGVARASHTIVEVRDGGDVVYRADETGQRVITEASAAMLTDVLRGVVAHGTAASAQIGRPVAGKTGTTQDYADAWFAGYTPQVAAVVWMGNRDDRSPLPGQETGGGLPASTWATFMAAVHDGLDVVSFPTPDGGAFDGAALDGTAADATPTPTATPTSTPSPTATPTAPPEPAPTARPEPEPTDAGGAPQPPPNPQPTPTAAPEPLPQPSTQPTPAATTPPTPAPRSAGAAPSAPPEPEETAG